MQVSNNPSIDIGIITSGVRYKTLGGKSIYIQILMIFQNTTLYHTITLNKMVEF